MPENIKVVNIEDKYTPEELQTEIMEKNFSEDINMYCKVNYIYNNPRNKRYTAFIEVEPNLFHKIMKEQKINIGWRRYKVYEDLDLRFCTNCSKLGHTKNKCTDTDKTCSKCMQKHESETCTNELLKCINCTEENNKNYRKHKKVDVNHSALDFKNCDTYKTRLKLLKSRINYTI